MNDETSRQIATDYTTSHLIPVLLCGKMEVLAGNTGEQQRPSRSMNANETYVLLLHIQCIFILNTQYSITIQF